MRAWGRTTEFERILRDASILPVLERLIECVGNRPVDLVMSDMAPNISGTKAVDQPRAMYLAELALDLARRVLAPGGDFLVKVFQGEDFDAYLREVRGSFGKVMIRKPKASRPRLFPPSWAPWTTPSR